MTRELSIEEVKGIFASMGVDFYYQLQHPGNAKILFIANAANRPEFKEFALTEAHYLHNGPKWVEEHGVIHPVLWMPAKTPAKSFWDSLERIWTGNNHERAAFLASDVGKISIVELFRWPYPAGTGQCKPQDDKEHFRFLATLFAQTIKHIVILGYDVLDELRNNAGLTNLPLRKIAKKDIDSSGFWTDKLGHITVIKSPSRNYWQSGREDRIIRNILNQF